MTVVSLFPAVESLDLFFQKLSLKPSLLQAKQVLVPQALLTRQVFQPPTSSQAPH